MSEIQLFDKNSELRFDGTAVGGGGAQPAVLSATVPLSSADILGLHTTPIVLVDGEAGFAICPINIGIAYAFGGTPYNEGGGSYRVFLGATFGSSGWGSSFGDGVFARGFSTATMFDVQQDLSSDTSEALNLLDGTPLSLDMSGSGVTAGDGTGSITVVYWLLPLT